MFSFSLSFSKPRIISIVLLLAILVISLLFTSYSEGMESSAMDESDAIKSVNKEAPKAKTSADAGPRHVHAAVHLAISQGLTSADAHLHDT